MKFRLVVHHPQYSDVLCFGFEEEADFLTSILTDIQGLFDKECFIEVYPADSSLRLAVIRGCDHDYFNLCFDDPDFFVG